MEITIEDLKRLSEIYEPIMERGQKLVNMDRKISKKYNLTVESIEEFSKDMIGFRCEDNYGDSELYFIMFNNFLDEEYYESQKKLYHEILRFEKEEKERQLKIIKEDKEKHEREMLAMLKEKYENGENK